ncbi:carboxyltransferase domain-containing protein [Allosaccharopolyspora coralli]|uniref:Carboxyltransferase domain-containing protein n=1 Tax=Allosaccharopolyspora coralli TaxID=2665642 RepID=A0A5Q3QGI7_9PSEU|nr:allophanate hydrolase subunit 1 [Allosaccharopolyspora coralli]QGK69927.1 carboxyltransferase domain-containing protein [Allosaccharopolyspora coralli]
MRFLACGDAAVLVEVADLDAVLALYRAVRAHTPTAVVEVVPAARTVLLHFDRERTTASAVEQAVRGLPAVEPETGDHGTVRVPVVYDGDDLAEVARLTGLSEREVVEAHVGTEWTVAFGGFAPGFGYLAGGDRRLVVPRRQESRTRVPTGAVGLAGEFSGIYPRESPGGWQLIGHTDTEIWQADRNPPALLRPGVRVRFDEVRS